MLEEAPSGLSAAQAAPVASGAYRDSLHIETDHTDRMVKRVVSDVGAGRRGGNLSYALVVEANTSLVQPVALDSA
jgi:hypothetical protein